MNIHEEQSEQIQSPEDETFYLPASHSQQRMWFVEKLQDDHALFTIPLVVKMQGQLNVDALEGAFHDLIDRHETLRTTFEEQEGELFQVISPRSHFVLERTRAAGDNEILATATALLQQPFDFAASSLLRGQLLQTAEHDYALILIFHHLIADGWSMSVFMDELTANYHARVQGQIAVLPELPIQYGDFAHHQQEWLNTGVYDSQLEYWKTQLGGSLPVLSLPSDFPPAKTPSGEGGRIYAEIEPEVVQRLRELARQEGVTLNMVLLAAYKLLLHRSTGQNDLLVGTPVAGRNSTEVEGLIGCFLNTLVIRTQIAEGSTFLDLLRVVKQSSLGALANQDVPIEKILEVLSVPRDQGAFSLVQSLFMYQNTPMSEWEMEGVTVQPLDIYSGKTKFDLTVSLVEVGQGITCSFEYRTDLWTLETAERMIAHYLHLLGSIVQHPQARIAEIDILSAEDRAEQLRWAGPGVIEYPADMTLPALFEERVRRHPDEIALVCQATKWTYKELNERANRLAHSLQAMGVGPEVLVGVCLERSAEMVMAVLAVLKAGGAYVPIDPAYPVDRIDLILETAQPAAVICHAATRGKLAHHKLPLVDLEAESAGAGRVDNPVSSLLPSHLAYVIFTSGSTGKPKGVMVQHDSLLSVGQSWDQGYGFARMELRQMQMASLSFDVFAGDLVRMITSGGTLVVCPEAVRTDIPALYELMVQERITFIDSTPSLLLPLMEYADQQNLSFPDLQILIIGADTLNIDDYKKLLVRFGDAIRIMNSYGTTETTVDSCFHEPRVEDVERTVSGYAPIGSPLANNRFYILDAQHNLLPAGVIGELYIGGQAVARGYYQREDLTVERFLPDPFVPGGRMYKTGDLVRWNRKGYVEFFGRADHQIKLRGFRIELGEIEAVLESHPSVEQAVVTAHTLENDTRLVAYAVPAPGQDLKEETLRQHVQEALPEYMVPSAFLVLDGLPLSPNGKVDRKALPLPEFSTSAPEQSYVAPRDQLEFRLAQIWEELLGVKQIGVHDDFFERGGHSLLAVRLMALIRNKFRANVPLATLFEGRTIEQLAVVLRTQRRQETAPSPLVPIRAAGSRTPFFCVHPGGGSSLCYYHLANQLHEEQPFYGFQARGLEDDQQPLDSVEALAAAYATEMKRIQPQGPYQVGGWSFGGLVAYEIARQLQAEGAEVALLALFDTEVPVPSQAAHIIDELAYAYAYAREAGCEVQIKIQEITDEVERERTLLDLLSEIKQSHLLPPDLEIAQFRQMLRVYSATEKATREYKPQPGALRATLFRAQDEPRPAYAGDPGLGWGALAQAGVEVLEVPGLHATMLEHPHVQAAAEALQAAIDRVPIRN